LVQPVLCLSVPIRRHDDRDFHIPSAALSLHLQSCEIVSASLWGFGQARRAAKKHSSRTVGQVAGRMHGTASEPRSISDERRWCSFVTLHSGGLLVAHWWFKVGYRGMPATEAFFLQQGLPAWLAWFDISFEVVIAVCLVLGIFVPLLCLISLPIFFASMWIYRRNGFYFSGGGIELPVLWACAQIAQVFLGPGAFRVPLPVWLQLPTLFGVPL
jgi:uncharacterized membrane protein YphA (DoxX/SURF4 family)